MFSLSCMWALPELATPSINPILQAIYNQGNA
jgi:hypothetical protein